MGEQTRKVRPTWVLLEMPPRGAQSLDRSNLTPFEVFSHFWEGLYSNASGLHLLQQYGESGGDVMLSLIWAEDLFNYCS